MYATIYSLVAWFVWIFASYIRRNANMIKKVFVCHDKSQRGSVCWLLATEMRQIGAIGLAGYYGFTATEERKVNNTK